jgi:histidine triad (HIT) family protein
VERLPQRGAKFGCSVAAVPITPPELDPCPFCDGLAGKHDWAIVDEVADSLAFIAPRPLRSGHVLVILKRHAPTVLDLSPDELSAVMRHTQRVARAVADALDASGLNIFQNSGVTAGQTVAHYHVHVLPSHPGNDPGRFIPPEERVYVPIEERQRLAKQIASRL